MGRITRLAAIAAIGTTALMAKAGLAEWSVDTPGGNLICSCDHGLVGLLVRGKVVAGVPVWWQTYTSNHLAGYVQTGDPAGQYFLLNDPICGSRAAGSFCWRRSSAWPSWDRSPRLRYTCYGAWAGPPCAVSSLPPALPELPANRFTP